MEDNKEGMVEGQEPEKTEERPEENYKAELARKNARIAQLESERLAAADKPVKRDPADISTWTDAELKMLRGSNDPSVAQYKDQADELLLERKVKQIQARDYETRRKADVQNELANQFPEALDSSSEFAQRMNKVVREYDLDRTPAGKLVAAKIVAADMKAASGKSKGKESDRVTTVKGQMVDGDRPLPAEVKNPNKQKDLKEKLLNEGSTGHEATAEWIDSRGLREKFGKTWGQ